MKCFFCGSEQSNVIDKRAVKSSGEIRRRRECLKCHRRFTTYERISISDFYVIKRSGSKEVFDRNKLRAGLSKALEKRPGIDRVEHIVERIEKRLKLKGLPEVNSKLIGQVVLSELKKLDKIAYLRFASVYHQYSEVSDFSKELEHLKV